MDIQLTNARGRKCHISTNMHCVRPISIDFFFFLLFVSFFGIWCGGTMSIVKFYRLQNNSFIDTFSLNRTFYVSLLNFIPNRSFFSNLVPFFVSVNRGIFTELHISNEWKLSNFNVSNPRWYNFSLMHLIFFFFNMTNKQLPNIIILFGKTNMKFVNLWRFGRNASNHLWSPTFRFHNGWHSKTWKCLCKHKIIAINFIFTWTRKKGFSLDRVVSVSSWPYDKVLNTKLRVFELERT